MNVSSPNSLCTPQDHARMVEIAEHLGFGVLLKYLNAKQEVPEDNADALAQSIVVGTIFGAEKSGEFNKLKKTFLEPEYLEFITASLMNSPTIKVGVNDVIELVETYIDRFIAILPE